jgi:hypothetical protein
MTSAGLLLILLPLNRVESTAVMMFDNVVLDRKVTDCSFPSDDIFDIVNPGQIRRQTQLVDPAT